MSDRGFLAHAVERPLAEFRTGLWRDHFVGEHADVNDKVLSAGGHIAFTN